MTTYSVTIPNQYVWLQELLDGLKGLVATYWKLDAKDREIQKQAIDKYVSNMSKALLAVESDGYTAMFLDQIVTIRADMKQHGPLVTCTQTMDGLVTALLNKLNKKKVSEVGH